MKICQSRKNMFSVMNHAEVINTRVIYNGISYELPNKAVLKNGKIKVEYLNAIKSSYNNMTREKAIELNKLNIKCLIA